MSKKDFDSILNKPKRKKKIYSHFRPFEDAPTLSNANENTISELQENKQQQYGTKQHTPMVQNNIQHSHSHGSKLSTPMAQNNTQHRDTYDSKQQTPMFHNNTQNSDNTGTETHTKYGTNEHTKYNNFNNQETQKIPRQKGIMSLKGNGRKVVMMLYEICRSRGELTSPTISKEFICNACNIKKSSIKTVIDRLVKSKFIARISYSVDSGGGTEYKFSREIYDEILRLETMGMIKGENSLKHANLSLINHGTYLGTNKHTNLGTSMAQKSNVVSSSNINTITTTDTSDEPINANLPFDWASIDFTELTSFGFKESHLIQIHREYRKKPDLALTPEIIQDSIYALAFDLNHNNAAESFRHSPVAVLVSLLKKGQPYSSKTPDKYVTPQQEAMSQYLAFKEREQRANLELEARCKSLEHKTWLDSLSEDELLEFCPDSEVPAGVPEKLIKTIRKKKARQFAQDYFDVEVWPNVKTKVLGKLGLDCPSKSVNAKEQLVDA